MMCSFATLDKASLEVVKTLEKDTGRIVLAYDCFSHEAISEEEVGKIQDAEKKLCRTLVAVKSEHQQGKMKAQRHVGKGRTHRSAPTRQFFVAHF